MGDPMIDSGHPTSAELLLAREEPSLRESRRVLEHLSGCPVCRQALSSLESMEREIADYCQTKSTQLPQPPPVEALRLLLRAERTPRRTTIPIRRSMVAAAALAACLIIALYLRNPLQPESVEAAEVLRRATEQVRTSDPARPRVFEFRTGNRVYRTGDKPDVRIVRSLEVARVNWKDPMNPSDFARWRDELANKTDRVTRDSGWVRLTTTVLGDGPVRSASLTVSQPDWRPIARTVEFRDSDRLEIREISGTVSESRRHDEASPQPSTTSVGQAAPASDIAVAALELRLWEVLRSIDADVLDGGDVHHRASGVCFEVWPDDARRERVRTALSAVPDAKQCAAGSGSASTARVLPPLVMDGESSAPFSASLAERFGSVESANRYVDRVMHQYVGLLARVSALERFLRSFPPARFDSLPSGVQTRTRALAAAHVSAIRSDGASYLDLVAEGLRAALPRDQQLMPVTGTADAGGCTAPLRASNSLLATDLKNLQAGFNRLFGGSDGSGASPEATLRTTVKQHAALARRLATLCIEAR